MNENESQRSKTENELFWSLHSDMRTHARHAEMLRSNAVNYVLVIATALIAIILSDRKVDFSESLLGLTVVIVGMFGLIFVASYTELYQRNRRRAERIRRLIDNRVFPNSATSLTKIIGEADVDHEATPLYLWSRRITGSSHRIWFALPATVIVVGLTLFVTSLNAR